MAAKKYDYHGSYSTKSEAVTKEKETGGFIREKKIGGKTRYFVLSTK